MVMRMKHEKTTHVDVLILNCNGKNLLERCLDSMKKTDYPDFKTFVIDNGSTDGSVELVKSRYPWVELIEIGRNVGVAAAYNQAIPRMNSEFIAILNNDVEVDKNWLKNLMSVISEDKNVAAVTCKIKFINNKRRINSTGGSCDIYGVGWNRGNGQIDNGQYNNFDEPFYSTGSAMIIKKSLWEKAGKFDERYFLYGEDLDWSWRARLLGYKIKYVPTSTVYHVWQASHRIVPIIYLLERNWLCTILKNYSLKTLLLLLPKYLVLKTLKAFWLLLRGKRNEKLAIPKAFMWNLLNLRKSLQKRKEIQSIRKISDQEIQKKMFQGSFELSLWLGTQKHPILGRYQQVKLP